MAKYKVPTQFIFTGYFVVEADSADEARKLVDEDCGLTIGGNIHSNLNDEDVDWDFSVHPDRKYGRVTKTK